MADDDINFEGFSFNTTNLEFGVGGTQSRKGVLNTNQSDNHYD
jgi:hypothetical protein